MKQHVWFGPGRLADGKGAATEMGRLHSERGRPVCSTRCPGPRQPPGREMRKPFDPKVGVWEQGILPEAWWSGPSRVWARTQNKTQTRVPGGAPAGVVCALRVAEKPRAHPWRMGREGSSPPSCWGPVMPVWL